MNSSSHISQRGFSLVEILAVISIIGIISGVAIPSISSFIDSADDAKTRRNIQNVATTYSSALAAGHNFAAGETDVADVIENVVAGATIAMSPGHYIYIGVPNLGAVEKLEVQDGLELIGNRLYVKNP